MRRWRLLALLFIAGLIVAGCERAGGVLSEQEESAYRRGKQDLREGKPDEALQAFLNVIEHRESAPESHLEAGLLYMNRFNEPILAIYHFNEYLRVDGSSEQADRVRQLIMTAKKDFAKSLPAGPFGNEVDNLDLKDLLEKEKEENASLKAQLQKAQEDIEHYKAVEQARLMVEGQGPGPGGSGGLEMTTASSKSTPTATSAASTAGNTSTPSKAMAGNQKYTVQSGDTLSTIAKKFYGASSRWKEIYEANKDSMPNPRTLKLGQVLVIP